MKTINKSKLYEVLKKCEKPARYIGEEINTPQIKQTDLSFCLCFPDLYEVAMSNIGIRILYYAINKEKDLSCERCFSPSVQTGTLFKENQIPLFSLETKTPLNAFDVLGFSFGYELSYTTFLYMLELASIPFKSKDRSESDPIVFGGGLCMCNPEPLADFLDFAVIGDGEEVDIQVLHTIKQCKKQGYTKRDILKELKKIDGVYVPSMVDFKYNKDKIVSVTGDITKKAVVKDLDAAFFPHTMQVANIEAVHDRMAVEVLRGCTRGCRFCQAGFVYRPIRERTAKNVQSIIQDAIDSTGYNECSLSSLSTGDYSQLNELIKNTKTYCDEKHLSLALPSLRLDSFETDFVLNNRKSSLTFAPEAGSQRLRNIINKNITDKHIHDACKMVFSQGYSSIKFYFMMGLPNETQEDLQGIVDICKTVKELYKVNKTTNKPLSISVSCATFIPKPFTPFQWCKQIDYDEAITKAKWLKDSLKAINVRCSYHDPNCSMLEGVLARGDRRLCDAIVQAYKNGAVFDSWGEFFDYGKWEESFKLCNIDTKTYTKDRDTNELLPWEMIDMMVSKDYLKNELQKAKNEQTTHDCRLGCTGCGLQGKDICNQGRKK